MQNHNLNPIKPSNLKKFLELGVWGLETKFVPLWSKRLIKS